MWCFIYRCSVFFFITVAYMYDTNDNTLKPVSCHASEPLKWRHNERDGISNHRHLGCLLNCPSGRRSKETSKLCVTGFCEGNPPVTARFSSKRAIIVENVSIWWRHHHFLCCQRWQSWHDNSRVFRCYPSYGRRRPKFTVATTYT